MLSYLSISTISNVDTTFMPAYVLNYTNFRKNEHGLHYMIMNKENNKSTKYIYIIHLTLHNIPIYIFDSHLVWRMLLIIIKG